MFDFTPQQRMKALCWLSVFHVLIITSSNYLVQLPISIFGFTPRGAHLLSRLFSWQQTSPSVCLARLWLVELFWQLWRLRC